MATEVMVKEVTVVEAVKEAEEIVEAIQSNRNKSSTNLTMKTKRVRNTN